MLLALKQLAFKLLNIFLRMRCFNDSVRFYKAHTLLAGMPKMILKNFRVVTLVIDRNL